MNNPMNSSVYSKLIGILAILLAALLVFAGGVAVGYRKAEFSNGWNDSYAAHFARPGSPFEPMVGDGDDSPNPHGAFGEVVAIHEPVITIKGPTEAEKNVIIGAQTGIRKLHSPASTTDIMIGDTVVVIGEPDDQGQIDASFVRILPAAQASSTMQ
jgi:hypothetical protein